MENNTVKKDNRKAFPKYLLILFVAAIFGGVLGFAAGWVGHDNLSEVIAAAGFDANVRGETLSIPEFARIANEITKRRLGA